MWHFGQSRKTHPVTADGELASSENKARHKWIKQFSNRQDADHWSNYVYPIN